MSSGSNTRKLAIPRLQRSGWVAHGCAVVIWAAALALRQAFDPVLPPGFPYLTFFPAVIVTAFLLGTGPGVLCAALSGLSAWYFFIPPTRSFTLSGSGLLALLFYVAIVSVDIALIHFMHRAGTRLAAEQRITDELYEQQRTLFKELQHRVANNMQFVASLLALQKRKVARDPGSAVAAIADAEERLTVISRLHRRLYDPAVIEQPVGIVLQGLCSDLIEATGSHSVACLVDMPPVPFSLDRLTTLSLLVAEIMTNALKHAFPEGRPGTVRISMEELDADRLALVIADDGQGMPPTFDPATSRSLGHRITQELAKQLGGRIFYSSGEGTTVRVEFKRELNDADRNATGTRVQNASG